MIPVLLKFSFETALSQVVLYVLALGLALYAGFAGFRGSPDGTRNEKLQRAAIYGVIGAGVARLGLFYALPATAFLGGKGEGFPVHTYGVMLALGFISAVAVASRTAEQEFRGLEGKRRREQMLDLSFWVLLFGILGSKVLFTLVNWSEYEGKFGEIFSHPAALLDLLGGGLVFQGGVLGAGLASFVWSRSARVRWPFLRLADLAIPTVSLGGAFGRLGCFSAGCCWGRPGDGHLPWAVHFPGAQLATDLFGRGVDTASLAFGSQVTDPRWVVPATGRIFHEAVPGAVRISEWVAQHGTTLALHPVQLYDALCHLAMFFGLMALRRYRRFYGQIFGTWLVAYSFQRYAVETFRGDSERGTLNGFFSKHGYEALAARFPLEAWYNVSTAQLICLCTVIAGTVLLVWGFRQSRSRSLSLPLGTAVA